MRIAALFTALAAAALGTSGAVWAADPFSSPQGPSRSLTIGAGAAIVPDFEGSEDYEVIPIVPFNYEQNGFSLRARGLGVEADLVPSRAIDAGPLIRYDGGRDDVENDAVDALPEVDGALELGGFFQANLPVAVLGSGDPSVLFSRVSFAQDVTDGHEGYEIEGSIGVFRPFSDRVTGILNLSTTYASEDYMDSFFSVTAAGSAASGLSVFDADAGFKDVGLMGIVNYKLNERWTANLIGGYTRLIGDAEDSSIVSEAGSEDQFFAGFAFNYTLF